MNRITLVLVLFCIALTNAQSSWKKMDSENFAFRGEKTFRKVEPTEYSLYSLNLEKFKNELTTQAKGADKIIKLPGYEGDLKDYIIKEYSQFTEPLHPKYGFIRTYNIQSTTNKNEFGKVSIGTDGVHMIISSPENGTFYIDPYTKDNQNYIAYNRKSINRAETNFECMVKDNIAQKAKISQRKNPDDGNLRTYRFALACTGEYAVYHLNDQGISGGTETERKAAVLSAMTTSLTRINQVFEKELAVKLNMVLVGGENPVLFLNSVTDGYTNDDIGLMIDENITRCNALIGTSNYDLGHLFYQGANSGLAYTPSVCSSFKAGGVTGRVDPKGDPFDVDFACHELGHQFGANHTQNNSCNRNGTTSVEPGSGSTIMSYAGICFPNVQANADDYFHSVSVDEMWNTLQGTFCGTTSATGNSAPTANAGLDYTVPAATPLILTGTATDADGTNGLTYNWEQLDNEVSGMPPVSASTSGPLFRSVLPNESPVRYLPALSTVLSGSTFSTWEVIPTSAREMDFSFNVRDNNPGGGSSARDDMKITVASSSGFRVTSFNTGTNVTGATMQTFTWDVASTDQSPINCQNVQIRLSTDGGQTFPIVIVSSTPNDGTQDIMIPNAPTKNARIMIQGVDNIFYNVNSTNFRILDNPTASVEDFDFENFNLFPNPSNGTFKLTFDIYNSDEVNIKLFDIRGRLVETKEYKNTSSTFTEELTFEGMNAGIYLLQVQNGNKKITKKLVIK
ncbi:Peptidase M12B domain-containing protein [Tenacibaculum sp. 190524A05c]|uniref:zinc-dependent metalloprotease n=1 Tax=Tenacibaculum platacis TaxID=3137852 RepID=UPI0031FB19EC